MPSPSDYIARIKKYLPDFINADSVPLNGILTSIANELVLLYNTAIGMLDTDWIGRGLRRLAIEEHYELSGREDDPTAELFAVDRYPMNARRGTLNGVMSDVGRILDDRNGTYLIIGDNTHYLHRDNDKDFNFKSDQLLTNGDFETGTLGVTPPSWTSANAVLSNTQTHGGTKSMKLPASGASTAYQGVSAKNGSFYTVEGFAYVANGKSIIAKLLRTKTGSMASPALVATLAINGTGAWQRFILAGTFPKSEDDVLRVQFEKTNDSADAYLDDILLQEDYDVTIGFWYRGNSFSQYAVQPIIENALSQFGKGYGIFVNYLGDIKFIVNDGVASDTINTVASLEPAHWVLLTFVFSHDKIIVRVNKTNVATLARTAFGNTNANNNIFLVKSGSDGAVVLLGDMQFIRGYADEDGSLSSFWYDYGMLVHEGAVALWRWSKSFAVGSDLSANGKNLTVVNLTSGEVDKSLANVAPGGYPSYPFYQTNIDDIDNSQEEVGWWVDVTYPGVDRTSFVGPDAMIFVDAMNRSTHTDEEAGALIRKEILPIDLTLEYIPSSYA